LYLSFQTLRLRLNMDPVTAFGVATAAIGLIPICGNALGFIETACKARNGAEVQVQRILMQKGVRSA
jgi:hypothetical protein